MQFCLERVGAGVDARDLCVYVADFMINVWGPLYLHINMGV